jgi:hypothetical protein
MEDIVNAIVSDAPPSDITDMIKNALYSKSAEKINRVKPDVATSMFGDPLGNGDQEHNNEE